MSETAAHRGYNSFVLAERDRMLVRPHCERFSMTKLDQNEIDQAEQSLGHKLPGLYHKLLVEIGYGILNPEAEVYHPAEVWELYEPFFEEPEQLFNPYFPFGNNPQTQEIWIIDGDGKRAASIWHETVPEDWPEEEWLTYEQWLQKYLKPTQSAA